MRAPAVGLAQVLQAGDGAGQHAPAQRRIGHEADAELAARGQDLRLGEAAPQGVFGLQGGDGMHLAGASQGVGPRLRQAEMAHLALLHQAAHRAHGVFNGCLGVHPVLVVEVDGLHPQPLQAGLAGGDHIIGAAVDAEAAARRADIAELGGEHRLGPVAVLQGPAQQFFVGPRAVHVGRVQEVGAGVQRLAQGGDRLVVIDRPVEIGHGHAAEPQGRHCQPVLAQGPRLHVSLLPVSPTPRPSREAGEAARAGEAA